MASIDSNPDTQTIVRVHDQLRTAILRGDLRADEEISQVQLARDLGISRTPLREVLRMLQREGLVIPQSNRRLQIAGVSLADLEQIYAARLPLEALAIRFTVPRLESGEIARMEGALAEMAHFASADEWDRWDVVHREFHHLLTQKSGRRLDAMLRELFDHSSRYRRVYALTEPSETWPLGESEHRAILDAAKAGDPGTAATQLVRHLARTPFALFEATDPQYEPQLLREALTVLTGSPTLAPVSRRRTPAAQTADGSARAKRPGR